ncbi:MAG: heparinase II/III family protein [Bacteroidales bacterium]|nr:heparinase II/III family protein [Bacteroidales bacterium]
MLNNRLIALLLAFLTALPLSAREDRNICKKALDALPDKAEVFAPGAWKPWPAYHDRAGWDAFTGSKKKELVALAKKYLKYKYKVVPATLYLEYEKTGNRKLFDAELKENTQALQCLIIGELAEGKGRFIPQIIDGIYYFSVCLPSWNGSGSDARDGVRNRMLPDPRKHLIALTSASRGPIIAAGLHFFKEEFDKADPMIAELCYKALEDHIFNPYLDEYRYTHGHHWLGFNGNRVSNWNTYCNVYVLQTFLLADRDPERLLRAVDQCTRSIDRYLDTNKLDGACDEGPSYWSMAGGKLYEYVRIMRDVSGGRIDLFGDDQVRRIMEWKSKNYVTDGWGVSFGDGFARQAGGGGLVFRIGADLGSREMADLGVSLSADPVKHKFSNKLYSSHDLYRTLEAVRATPDYEKAQQEALQAAGGDWDVMMNQLRANVSSAWYKETEHAFLRNASGWFLGVKGGHNAEHHNHNDAGSGVLFVENCPVLIDAGVATYTHTLLNSVKRYDHYWNVQSQWHNLPLVNGVQQMDGAKYAARDTRCDVKANTFQTDIAGAYPAEAAAGLWVRSYALSADGLSISDHYALDARKAPDVEVFVVQPEPILPGESLNGYKVKAGEVLIPARSFDGRKTIPVLLRYPRNLTPSKEENKLNDERFLSAWGESIWRIKFTSDAKAPLKGVYEFKVKRL